ncbi:hypothetical protein E2542_SST27468 [Spatholobus suberectus]|nr:hypothetical protein E2542_SST27468 [Spatholobus suberectus]
MEKASLCLRSLDVDVDSMFVSRFNLTVAIEASVHVYDLCNFDRPIQSKEACNGIHLRCVCSIPDAKVVIVVVATMVMAVVVRWSWRWWCDGHGCSGDVLTP